MNCPCCSGTLLRHIGRTGLYWYCLDCHQAMPILPDDSSSKHSCQPRFVIPPKPEQSWQRVA